MLSRRTLRAGRLLVLLGLITLPPTSPLTADPLPMPMHWMGGRLVPARAVPVDMTGENLVVHLAWHQPARASGKAPERGYNAAEQYFARADVEVTYTLRADARLTVPIVFPVVNEAQGVQFELNGQTVATKTTSDVKLYPAYERAWRATIDRYVSADRALAALRGEAQKGRSASAQPAPGQPPDRYGTRAFMAIYSRVSRRLGELRRPDAERLSWALTHYLLDDWDALGQRSAGVDMAPDSGARRKLTAERTLALAFDPQTPDPAALWCEADAGQPTSSSGLEQFSFISADLALRRGDNQLRVRYGQPVSFINARYEMPAGRDGRVASHKQASVFEFILRTARFWRSFGSLSTTVHLPPGTVYAACSMRGASVALGGRPPTVTCRSQGLPDHNLAVTFADFKVLPGAEPEDPSQARPGTPPSSTLKALWDRTLPSGRLFHAVPAVDDTTVAVGGPGAVTLCERASGRVTKTIQVPGQAEGLLLEQDVIYAGLDLGYRNASQPALGVVCLDRHSGATRWSQSVAAAVGQAYPVRLARANEAIMVWADRGPALAVDAAGGKPLWRQEGEFRAATVAPDGSTAYLAGVAKARREAASSDDRRFGALAELLAVDMRTGETRWHSPAGFEGTALALWGDRIVMIGTDARYKDPYVTCLSKSGKTLWKKPLGANVGVYNTVYATRIQGDRLLVVRDAGVDAYDLQSPPAVLWHASFKYQLFAPPPMTDRLVYVPGRVGGIQSFSLETGKPAGDLRCTGADCTAAVEGHELFTLEHSGLLTAWSLDAAGSAQSPLTPASATGTGWPGVPPADLASALLGGTRSSALQALALPPSSSSPLAHRLRYAGVALLGVIAIVVIAAAVARRRRWSSQ